MLCVVECVSAGGVTGLAPRVVSIPIISKQPFTLNYNLVRVCCVMVMVLSYNELLPRPKLTPNFHMLHPVPVYLY